MYKDEFLRGVYAFINMAEFMCDVKWWGYYLN